MKSSCCRFRIVEVASIVEVANNHRLYFKVQRRVLGWLWWKTLDTVNEGGGVSPLRFPTQEAADQWVRYTFGGTAERVVSIKEIVP